MLPQSPRAHLAAILLLLPMAAAADEELWSLYQPACLAGGIDPNPCLCILDEVVRVHGEDAARFVGLDMLMRYDEAAALRDAIGEDKAFAASSLFDLAQNKNCSAGRLARLKGLYTGAGTGADAASESTTAEGAVQRPSARAAVDLSVIRADAPVIDLRDYPEGAIVDVKALLSDPAFAIVAGKNIRNYVAIYRIADLAGGVDTDGDDAADLRPGDAAYASFVQSQGEGKRLYFSEDAGTDQYLGEVRLPGGAMYALYLRFDVGQRSAAVLNGLPTDRAEPQALLKVLSQQRKSPSHLYFVFAPANPGGASYLLHRGDGDFGFEYRPDLDEPEFSYVVIRLSIVG